MIIYSTYYSSVQHEEYDEWDDKVNDPNINQQKIFEIRASSWDKNHSIPGLLAIYSTKGYLAQDSAPYKLFSRLVHASLKHIEEKNYEYDDIIATIIEDKEKK